MRPFASWNALLREAESTWTRLGREDWLEAFSHHPRIGERNLAQAGFKATAVLAGREQAGMATATNEQRREFEALNAQYEKKFGHVFLICAAGKGPDEMLAQLRWRLNNDSQTELHNAAREQNMITRLRLERMLLS